MSRKLAAEFFGTFWLVFGGCGSAVLAAAFPHSASALSASLWRSASRSDHGLCRRRHFRRPLQSRRLARACVASHFPWQRTAAYWIAQVLGGIAGAAVLYLIASGTAGFRLRGGFASNGYGDIRPAAIQPASCADRRNRADFDLPDRHPGLHRQRAPAGFAPIAIGLGLTLIHLISIPVTNTSVNPARSTAARSSRGLGARAALAVLGGAAGRRGASAP